MDRRKDGRRRLQFPLRFLKKRGDNYALKFFFTVPKAHFSQFIYMCKVTI